jgi:glyoxylase-like metal-dependent hydrolase (beta-lactamase superfamily II)
LTLPENGHALDPVNIHVLPAGLIPTNSYLLTEPGLGQAILIDAPGDVWAAVEPILKAEKCRLTDLWITHGHWDHVLGAAEVVRATGVRVTAHKADQVLVENPGVMSAYLPPGTKLESLKVDVWLNPPQKIPALGGVAEVRHVPGHCPGNVLFYFAGAGAAFLGDALFQGSVGRTDLPGGDFPTLEKSIRSQIYTLPDDTVVYSGHGPETTVGEEKEGNPYVPAAD